MTIQTKIQPVFKMHLAFFLFFIFYHNSYANLDDHTSLLKGKKLYEVRCMMCHGQDAKATGPLAQKSDPPTPDLTSCDYQKKLAQSPGRMVASIVLTPGGDLIPKTLKTNHISLPPHTYTDQELKAVNEYLLKLIKDQPLCVDPKDFKMHI